mgnify:CR=1 FL=1
MNTQFDAAATGKALDKLSKTLLEFNKKGEQLAADLDEQVRIKLPQVTKMLLDALEKVAREIAAWTPTGPPGAKNPFSAIQKFLDADWKEQLGMIWEWVKAHPVLGSLIAMSLVAGAANLIMGGVNIFRAIKGIFGKGGVKAGEEVLAKTGEKVVEKVIVKEATGVLDASGRMIMKDVEKEVVKDATQVATKTATEATVKATEKAASKTILKSIPLLGIGAGLYFAYERLMQGQYGAAGLEVASGILHSTPFTAFGWGIDAGLVGYDVNNAMKEPGAKPTAPAVPSGQITQGPKGEALQKNRFGEIGYYERNGRAYNWVAAPNGVIPATAPRPPTEPAREGGRRETGTATNPVVTTPAPGKSQSVVLDGIKHSVDGSLFVAWDSATLKNLDIQLFKNMNPVKLSIDSLTTQLATPKTPTTSGVKTASATATQAAPVNPEISATDLKKLEEEGKKNMQIFALATMIKQNRDSMQSLADLNVKMASLGAKLDKANVTLEDSDTKLKKIAAK